MRNQKISAGEQIYLVCVRWCVCLDIPSVFQQRCLSCQNKLVDSPVDKSHFHHSSVLCREKGVTNSLLQLSPDLPLHPSHSQASRQASSFQKLSVKLHKGLKPCYGGYRVTGWTQLLISSKHRGGAGESILPHICSRDLPMGLFLQAATTGLLSLSSPSLKACVLPAKPSWSTWFIWQQGKTESSCLGGLFTCLQFSISRILSHKTSSLPH